MPVVTNGRVIFNEIPEGYPEPGKTVVYDEAETLDLDSVVLNGGILVKTLVLSADPYMRGQMRDPSIETYVAAFTLGKPIYGYGIGVVLRSESTEYKTGDHVHGHFDYKHYQVIQENNLSNLRGTIKRHPKLPWTAYTGVAGGSGRTALYAWRTFAQAKPGNTVFVTTGAGPVGSMVIQIAKSEGLRVIASAGTDDKVAFVKEIGADVAFNYKTTDTATILAQEGPLDIYWDNVGGETLDLALKYAARYARFIECGMISGYNHKEGHQMKNLFEIIARRITISGFIVGDLATSDLVKEFEEVIIPRLAIGEFRFREDITEGLEHAGETLARIQRGTNVGKTSIVVGREDS
ncbi:NAD(P)-binding protein [Cylindrobasidium torrendii FP15055 ss-10]|uniref:NAD(P)-binding protein n=1 Tax=Cylindrobasidium torrendii FP15055 ss-10 TaxID=1314674 RepID=A0A0D7BBQ1_9AGAR|nr:NAD(P)-binding protein [Cylindrobasidium torrendii FP15055 ss-10]